MNIDKSNSATPVGTDKIVISRQDIAEYTCTLEKLKGYKSYVALWSVSDDPGNQTPTVVVLNNDFTGVTFNWEAPGGVGSWGFNANSPVFTNNKTVCFFQNASGAEVIWSMARSTDSLCILEYPGGSGELAISNCSLEIRVYN